MIARGPDPKFWRDRRVFVTGHTGFKGSWLSLWLERLGANVVGFALPPESEPSAYTEFDVAASARSVLADVRDRAVVTRELTAAQPEVVFHLAAQPLVLRGYREPVETFATNVQGTVHVLDAVRVTPSVRAVVVVTTDKVYAEHADGRPYVETDALGGVEPYGASKACAELVVDAYRASFLREAGVAVATARAGNVIGGGDWSADRLIPDLVRALQHGERVTLRYPDATRPWQHVLDPLAGYLLLAETLAAGGDVTRAWNFGPSADDVCDVGEVTRRFESLWGGTMEIGVASSARHEAPRLALDASAARRALQWTPMLHVNEALAWTAVWYKGVQDGHSGRKLALDQLAAYDAVAVGA